MCNMLVEIEDYINTANNKIAAAAGSFINCLDEVKKISGDDEKALIEQNLVKIDQAYENILAIYRPNVRKFVENHIRTIAATDKLFTGTK